MGKILIIRGASYTPPSGSGSSGSDKPSVPDNPVNPNPTTSEYTIYYLDASNTWYRNRSSATTIKAVGIVVSDTWATDIIGVNNSLSASTPKRKLLFIAENVMDRGESFADDQSQYATADVLPASGQLPSNTRSLLIWLDDEGADLSSDRVSAIVSAAQQSITFVHG